MRSDIVAGRMVAVLFVGTMLAGMVDAYYVAPQMTDPSQVATEHRGWLLTGAFAVMAMAVGIFVLSAVLYPVVARHSVTVAVAYAGLRAVECVLLLLGAGCYLVVDALVGHDVGMGSGLAADMSLVLVDVKLVAYQMAMVVLGVGSLMLCTVFYRSRLLPRWLSGWGLAGYALLGLSAILDVVGVIDTEGTGGLLYVPGGLWELVVLPSWLLVRGFAGTEKTAAPVT